MAMLQLFQDCFAGTITVKKAFAHLGMAKLEGKDEPFKVMDEEAVVACLINWVIHQMPNEQQLNVRFKAQAVYEAKLIKHNRRLQVKRLNMLAKNCQDFVLYDWNEETTYNRLTERSVKEATARADRKNREETDKGKPCNFES